MALGAVLFDLDGTLVDSEREYAEAMARALAGGQGLAISRADKEFIIGRSWVDIHANLRARFGDALAWSRERLIDETFRERCASDEPVRLLPGAREIVRRFARLPCAVVTGSSRQEAALSLGALAVDGAFGAVIASEDCARSKPAPDGYLAAAAALGVAPDHCLVIEDSHAGVAAGLAAGAAVVAVRAGNFVGADQSAAHRVVDTLDEITVELAERLAGAAR